VAVGDVFGEETVSVSPLKVSREIEQISKTRLGSHYDINDELRDISLKVEKSVQVNIQLQEKITELGEAIANLARDVKSIAEASGVPTEPQERMPAMSKEEFELPPVPEMPKLEEMPELEERPSNSGKMASQLGELTKQNLELVKTLKEINQKLEQGSTKERLRKALERTQMM